MVDGRCPFAVWRGDDGQHGYPQGTTGQNEPLILVHHIMAGHKSTLDNEAWRRSAMVDVHFGIGDDGSKSQYTNIFDAAWGNGVAGARFAGDRLGVERYDRANRHLAELERTSSGWQDGPGFVWLRGPNGGSWLNLRSVSFEHDKFPETVWTPAKVEASIEVSLWVVEEVERVKGYRMPIDEDLLVGHFQIDGVNRPNCPGPNWPKAQILGEMKKRANTPETAEEDEMQPVVIRRNNSDTFALADAKGKKELSGLAEAVAYLKVLRQYGPDGKTIAGGEIILSAVEYDALTEVN